MEAKRIAGTADGGDLLAFAGGHVVPVSDRASLASGSNERESETFIASLARGLSVICTFGPQHGAMTLSEVATRSDITRAGARRILLTLQHLGYVAVDGRRFQLTPKILDLGYSFLSSLDIWQFAEPIMERLVETVHESCSASVLDGDDIVYVLRVPTRRLMSINLGIGTRLPAYATSMGRVLLATLSDRELSAYLTRTTRPQLTPYTAFDADHLRRVIADVRRTGWCLVDQELEKGLRSIAVPLTNSTGRVVAALNISAHASRVSAQEMVYRRCCRICKTRSGRSTIRCPLKHAAGPPILRGTECDRVPAIRRARLPRD